MAKKKETGVFQEKGATVGHNSKNEDKLRKSFIERYMALNEQKRAIAEDQKALLREAKDNGFLKTSLKNAVKILEQTEEQEQTRREIEAETRYNVQLFANSEGQYSFLQQESDGSENEAA